MLSLRIWAPAIPEPLFPDISLFRSLLGTPSDPAGRGKAFSRPIFGLLEWLKPNSFPRLPSTARSVTAPTLKRSGRPRRSVTELFFSYSHKDEPLRDQLETHLRIAPVVLSRPVRVFILFPVCGWFVVLQTQHGGFR